MADQEGNGGSPVSGAVKIGLFVLFVVVAVVIVFLQNR